MRISISKNTLLKIFALLIAVLVIVNFALLNALLKKNRAEEASGNTSQFDLLYPVIAGMEISEFRAMQKYYQTNYLELKTKVKNVLDSKEYGNYSYYFEDINTGAWIGVNEKEKSTPGSLLKIPVIVAVLKRVDDGDFEIDSPVTILEEDVDPIYGPLAAKGYGYSMAINELINYSTYYSDNTANAALRRTAGQSALSDAILGLGVTYGTFVDFENSNIVISAKEYSNILRSLYYSSYLRRYYSQMILSHLTNTAFKNGLPAGIPAGVKIAHKIGDIDDYYHDCGIVYYPKKPYILCVMVRGVPKEEAIETIRELSEITYEYVGS